MMGLIVAIIVQSLVERQNTPLLVKPFRIAQMKASSDVTLDPHFVLSKQLL